MSNKAFVQNAANPSQVKEAGIRERLVVDQHVNDMKFVLSDPRGRRLIWHYLKLCRVFETTFHGQFETFVNEGRRQVGLTMLKDVNETGPENYIKMSIEALEEEKK